MGAQEEERGWGGSLGLVHKEDTRHRCGRVRTSGESQAGERDLTVARRVPVTTGWLVSLRRARVRGGDVGTGGEATHRTTRVTELGQSDKGREPGDVGVTTARSYQEGEGQWGQILSTIS